MRSVTTYFHNKFPNGIQEHTNKGQTLTVIDGNMIETNCEIKFVRGTYDDMREFYSDVVVAHESVLYEQYPYTANDVCTEPDFASRILLLEQQIIVW